MICKLCLRFPACTIFCKLCLRFPACSMICKVCLRFPTCSMICKLCLRLPACTMICKLCLRFPACTMICKLCLRFPACTIVPKTRQHVAVTLNHQSPTTEEEKGLRLECQALPSAPPRTPNDTCVTNDYVSNPQRQSIVFIFLCAETSLWISGKTSALIAADPGSKPALPVGIFPGSRHTSDFKTGTPVAKLPDNFLYRVSTGTG